MRLSTFPRQAIGASLALAGLLLGVSTTHAQATPQTELSRLKTAYLADLADLENKLVALSEAFPADKYSWRPMEGVRSVSQVLGLIAAENYLTLTRGFGGTVPAGLPSGQGALEEFEGQTDRALLIKQVKESFALAKQAIGAWTGDPAGPIRLWGEQRTLAGAFMTVMADQHEHLGQLIAYARMNKIVPPWSH